MTSREYFRTLKVAFFALVSGQLFFALISVLLIEMGKFTSGMTELRNVFLLIALVFIALGVTTGILVFRKRITSLREQTGLPEKMTGYRSALIVRYALLEIPAFVSLIFFLVTGDYLLLGLAFLVIIFFLTLIPTVPKAIADLELNYNEKKMISDPDAVITGIK